MEQWYFQCYHQIYLHNIHLYFLLNGFKYHIYCVKCIPLTSTYSLLSAGLHAVMLSCYSTTMFPYFFSLNNLYLIRRLFTLTINTRMAITTSIISMMRRTQTTTTGPTIAPTLTGGTGMTVESKIIATHSKF